MKKVITALLALTLLIGLSACGGSDNSSKTSSTASSSKATSSTAATKSGNYTIPKAAGTITVDGKINTDEWKGAYTSSFSADSLKNGGGFAMNKKYTTGTAVKQYFLYTDDGLYLAFEVTDKTKAPGVAEGAALNATDAMQILFDIQNKKTNKENNTTAKEIYIFDFAPGTKADRTGPAAWFEHWIYNKMDSAVGIKVASVQSDNGYVLEVFMPWKSFSKGGETITGKSGMKFGMGSMILDCNSASAPIDIYGDFGTAFASDYANASKYNTYTLA